MPQLAGPQGIRSRLQGDGQTVQRWRIVRALQKDRRLPVDVIGRTIGSMGVDDLIAVTEQAHSKRKRKRGK